MFNALLVFVGAGFGGMCRFALAGCNKSAKLLPLGTLLANLLGCFCAGILLAYVHKESLDKRLYYFLMPGFLGGFTTFSAFSGETVVLLQQGHVMGACLNIGISVVGGLCATGIGYAMAKHMLFSW